MMSNESRDLVFGSIQSKLPKPSASNTSSEWWVEWHYANNKKYIMFSMYHDGTVTYYDSGCPLMGDRGQGQCVHIKDMKSLRQFIEQAVVILSETE